MFIKLKMLKGKYLRVRLKSLKKNEELLKNFKTESDFTNWISEQSIKAMDWEFTTELVDVVVNFDNVTYFCPVYGDVFVKINTDNVYKTIMDDTIMKTATEIHFNDGTSICVDTKCESLETKVKIC